MVREVVYTGEERLERDATVEGTADRLNTTERSQERERFSQMNKLLRRGTHS